tara:strand:- start:89 stop:223 length:135 start_codon:yes stop_codon:yes gene_type:complete
MLKSKKILEKNKDKKTFKEKRIKRLEKQLKLNILKRKKAKLKNG